MLKGVKKLIIIYDVGGFGGKYNLFLQKREEIYLFLKEVICLYYVVLDGKNVGNYLLNGSLVKLLEKEVEIQGINFGGNILLVLMNIKFNFLWDGKESEDVYGKVLDKKLENGNFYICFMVKLFDVAVKLEVMYKLL